MAEDGLVNQYTAMLGHQYQYVSIAADINKTLVYSFLWTLFNLLTFNALYAYILYIKIEIRGH